MSPTVFLCLVSGVALSAGAQIVLKMAMMNPRIQELLMDGEHASPGLVALGIASTPLIYAGMALYGLSMAVWLYVLSRIDVSLAYPFMGLGIVMTAVLGHVLLGEQLSMMRVVGCLVVATGLVIVARS